MSCYSHLSDAEREQIGLAKTVGHSIDTIAKAIGRPKSTVSRELLRNRLPSGRYSPLHAAGAYQLRRRRGALIEKDEPCEPSLSTGRVDPRANFRLAEGRKRTSSACRGLREDLRLHLQDSPTGRAVMALSHAPSQTPPPAPIETFCEKPSRIASLLVLHEGKSRVTLAVRLTGKTAAETIAVMLAVRSDRTGAAQVYYFRQ